MSTGQEGEGQRACSGLGALWDQRKASALGSSQWSRHFGDPRREGPPASRAQLPVSRQPRVGAECSPFLPFPFFREEPPGFEAKEDYPLSKEELLSYVMKSVRTEN